MKLSVKLLLFAFFMQSFFSQGNATLGHVLNTTKDLERSLEQYIDRDLSTQPSASGYTLTARNQLDTLYKFLSSFLSKKIDVNNQDIQERAAFILSGLTFLALTAKNHSTSVSPLTLLKNYAQLFTVVLAHELGHAGVAYVGTGEMPTIYLGGGEKEGFEILPHLVITGLKADGATEGIDTNFLSKQERIAIVNERFAIEKSQKPEHSIKEIVGSILNKEKKKAGYTVCILAGVASGLIANAGIKWVMGENPLAIDYVDIAQLMNLFPANGTDGGNFCKYILGFSDATIEKLTPYFRPVYGIAFLSKALSEADQPNNFLTGCQALGIALCNYGLRGLSYVS